MMGPIQESEPKLFHYGIILEKRVRPNNPLRAIQKAVDFGFVREDVKGFYGKKGHESEDPILIMKLMLLLFLDDHASERELMRVVGERLDYLWFLGLSLEDEIPTHSVLSKARRRWGREVFEKLFMIRRCLAASEESTLSKTDLDTAVVRKGRGDGARPRYKNHRVVDDRFGVITALETTAGDIAENTKLLALVQQHESNTGLYVETVVGDTQYGTNDNFAECHKRGIRSHMADLKKTYKNDQSKAVFGEEQFHYDAEQDIYICPAGETLQREREDRGFHVYSIGAKICRNCSLRTQCTRSKTGRRIKRHPDYEHIQRARQQSHSRLARQDRRRRRYLMEGSFADAANNHGLKRARWRGLKNQQTQDYLIATCQNIRTLIRRGGVNSPVRALRMRTPTMVNKSIVTIAALSTDAKPRTTIAVAPFISNASSRPELLPLKIQFEPRPLPAVAMLYRRCAARSVSPRQERE